MPFNLIPEERLERVQRELRASLPEVPHAVNVEPLMQLGEDQLIEFDGRLLRVPPVPFRAGLRLNELWIRVQRMSEGEPSGDLARDCARVIAEIVAVMGTLARPTGVLRPLLWRLGYRPNPFARVTETEVAALVGFFAMCRTRSIVRLSLPTRSTARSPKT